jgi:hypothetical protein
MSSDPPTLLYRGGGEGKESDPTGQEERKEAPRPYVEVARQVLSVLTWIVLFVVLLIWAVVGAVFWIPLILRALIRFSISLIEAMFEGHKPATAARILRDAVSFYRRGFVVAIEAVTGTEISDKDEGPVTQNRLLMEFLWALLVWYFIALLFGWIQASPLDLLDWFLSVPWADHIRDLIDRFTATAS